MEKTKEELIESLGIHLEKEYNLPPLAGRIYAILVLTEKDGLTFEGCLDKFGASKSSISTSFNLLLNMGLVTYFTKPGDRRRHFKTAKKKTFFLSKLQENLTRLEKEKQIITLVMGYHQKYAPKKFEENQLLTKVYLDYIDENENILKNSIKKFESILNE